VFLKSCCDKNGLYLTMFYHALIQDTNLSGTNIASTTQIHALFLCSWQLCIKNCDCGLAGNWINSRFREYRGREKRTHTDSVPIPLGCTSWLKINTDLEWDFLLSDRVWYFRLFTQNVFHERIYSYLLLITMIHSKTWKLTKYDFCTFLHRSISVV
jgi:hypothetical protein